MPSEPSPIAAELGEAVELYQASVDDFDREVARLLGVNETDLRCLEILIQDVPDATPRLLADRLGLTTGSVTAMLDRLERLNYITRSPHPTDRRKIVVRATPAIAELAHGLIDPLVEEGSRDVLARYSVQQIKLMIDFLTRLRDLQLRHILRLRALPTSVNQSTPPARTPSRP